MHLNHELYQQFLKGKNKQPQSLRLRKRRELLSGFIDLPDSPPLTLQSSIPFLKQLGVITSIETVDHIIRLMETKQSSGWQGSERQLSECRLIYFIWDVIAQQQVEVREFKELLMILAGDQVGRVQAIQSLFGEKQEILELIETWDRIFWDQTDGPLQEEINDISIIKSKNQGNIGDNKENQYDQANFGFGSSRRSEGRGYRSGSNLQKSYQKRSAKTGLDRSNSAARINSRRSDGRSSMASRVPELHCFSESDSLSVAEEQKLVERLYDYGKYKQREELKRKLEEERIQVELRQCTFKPRVCSGSRVKPVIKEVKGYGKAIERMKLGYLKKAELQRNLQYRVCQEQASTGNLKPTVTMAPRFHSRKPKEERNQLFELKFTLGRMVIPVRIRESDSVDQLVQGVGKVYSLKEHQKVYIRESIFEALQQYWIAMQSNQDQQMYV